MTLSGEERVRPDDEFAVALRAAIAARGLSLDRVRYHLSRRGHEVSVATLSYWQSGRSRPERATSLAALGELEEILQVKRGDLASRLPVRRRNDTKPAGGDNAYFGPMSDDGKFLDEALGQLGLTWENGLQRVAVHDRVQIDASHRGVSHGVRELLVATADGADRFPLFYQHTDSSQGTYVTPIRNCHLGRTLDVPEHSLIVAELILDHPLGVGESILVEHELGLSGAEVTEAFVERGFLKPVRSAHTEVVFDPSAVPLSAERYSSCEGTQKLEPVVISGPSLHALVLDFGPGVYGLRWTW